MERFPAVSMPASRGNAMPETVLMVVVLLLLVFSGIEFGMYGYLQAQADGAAFVGARSLSGGSSPSAANALAVAIFPQAGRGSFATPVPGTVRGQEIVGSVVSIVGSRTQIPFGPLLSATLTSHIYEARPAALVTPDPITGNFKVPVVCAKVVLSAGFAAPVDTPIHLAQDPKFDYTAAAGGPVVPYVNPPYTNEYGEFTDHQNTYDAIERLIPPASAPAASWVAFAVVAQTLMASIHSADSGETCR